MEGTGRDVMQRAGQDRTGWDGVTCQQQCLHTGSSLVKQSGSAEGLGHEHQCPKLTGHPCPSQDLLSTQNVTQA